MVGQFEFKEAESILAAEEARLYTDLLGRISDTPASEKAGIELICTGNAGGVDNVVKAKPCGAFRIHHGSHNIQIDPGQGTLRLLKDLGIDAYSTTDIIVTHAHNDHSQDLAGLVGAVSQIGLTQRPYRIVVNPTLVSYANTELVRHGFVLPSFSWQGGHVDVLWHETMDITRYDGKQIQTVPETQIGDMTIHPTRCIHGEPYTIGLIIDSPLGRIGYTSDTEYFPGIEKQFEGCDVLWANLNTINLGSFQGEQAGHVRNHLGYKGLCQLIEAVRPGNVFVSHFGSQILSRRTQIEELLRDRFASSHMNIYCPDNGEAFTFDSMAGRPTVKNYLSG